MTFREFLFFVFLAMGETGLYFQVEHPTHVGTLLLMFGSAGVAYVLFKAFRGAGPIVDAIEYRYKGGGGVQGIALNATREPAYGVHVESAAIGEYTLHFDGELYRLDGDGFLPAVASRGKTHSTLEGVWTNFKSQGAKPLARIPLVIAYKDAEGHRYKTRCELRRNVDMPAPGFDLRFVKRGMVGPVEQVRDFLKNRKHKE